MRVEKIRIEEFRSIKSIELNMPKAAPLVLYGPNNAGKSNILTAIDRLLGDKWPLSIEMLESDYFMRDSVAHPCASIVATFDEAAYQSKYGSGNTIGVDYWCPGYPGEETRLHDGSGNKVYGYGASDRAKCPSYLIGAERNITTALSYSSRYSLLSRFTHRIHAALAEERKDELREAFNQIKATFEGLSEYSQFVEAVKNTVDGTVKGFTHSLDIDLSAYDPNNYANGLRIVAAEDGAIRSFDEFGTGEQQILLMAFAKAYLQVFGKRQGLVLIIEEPEAHLHPLAQRWLKKYIYDICKEGVQVVVSTHSADFLDPRNLEGLVRVYKEGGITKTKQVAATELAQFCINFGAPKRKTTSETVADYYAAKVAPDQLRGMFADKVLLVEGPTESLALPVYFDRCGFSLAAEGIEIVECHGKEAIPLFWRLYSAFGYKCYCLFDGDKEQKAYDKHFADLFDERVLNLEEDSFTCEGQFAYFGDNWESYFSATIPAYDTCITEMQNDFGIETSSKQALAYAYAVSTDAVPAFIDRLIEALNAVE